MSDFMDICKKPFHVRTGDGDEFYECGKALADEGCSMCQRSRQLSEQWEEVKIEDVQPGDVARCNGREFIVHHHSGFIGLHMDETVKGIAPAVAEGLGITFHRKVKQPPQSFELTLTNVSINVSFLPGVSPVTRSNVTLPGVYPRGARFRVELLDGEDGA